MDSLNSLDAGSQFLYDYADFLQRIKDTYTKGDEETVGTFWNISTGIKIPSNVVGYKNEKVVEIALQNRVIGNQKPFGGVWVKTNNITAFTADVNWDRFQTNIELTHDLITVTNEVWGRNKQKEFLKEKILERCREYNQAEFELTEKTLGAFEERSASSADDVSVLKQSENNLETNIEFCKAINALKEEGFLSLQGNIDINFSANFIHLPKKFLYGYESHRYYPPEHCKVKVKVLGYLEEFNRNQSKQIGFNQQVGQEVPQNKRQSLQDRYQELLAEIKGHNQKTILSKPAERFIEKKEDEDIKAKLKEVDEIKKRLEILEQKKVSPKQFVNELLKTYKFPKMRKKFLKALADGGRHETGLIKNKVGTRDLPTLKSDTEETIRGHKLDKALVIKSERGRGEFASVYYYQLEIHQESFPRPLKTSS